MRAHGASSRPTYFRVLVELSIAAVALGMLLAGALIAKAHQPLDSKHLKIAAADLNSLAATGVLLASQSARGSLTENYFEVQSRSWREKVETANEELLGSFPVKDQQRAYEESAALAKDLSSVAGQLTHSRPDETERAGLLHKLQTLEARASASRSSLTHDANAQ